MIYEADNLQHSNGSDGRCRDSVRDKQEEVVGVVGFLIGVLIGEVAFAIWLKITGRW